MNILKKTLAAFLAGIMLVGAAACGSGTTDTASAGTNVSTTGTTGGTGSNVLNVHLEVEVASMDPQIATDGTSLEMLAAVTEGLYSVDADGNPIFAMAESVEKSEDGLKYTYTLRDAEWSNGTPVTANDFVYAWQRLVDPTTASEYAFLAGVAGIENADAISSGNLPVEELGVKAIDDKTLEVTLDFPVAFFESLMTFPPFLPVNQAFHEEKGNLFATSPETILANGPFKVKTYEPAATTIELVKNDNYWDAQAVSLDGIKFQVIKESQQAVLSFQNGDLDVTTLSGEQVETFEGDPELHDVMAGYLWYITPNTLTPGLENENLRKAIALSYDKEAIVDGILKDGSTAADFAVPIDLATGPDGKDFRETTGTYLETNKEQAKEYFEKAKEELGQDTFKYTMLVEDTEASQNVAQFLQSEIQTTLPGLTINIEVLPKKNRVERIQNGDYELCLTRWGPDYADPLTYLNMWITGSPNNYGDWSNAEYDAIIESATKGELALDPEGRWKALQEAEAIVMDEAVIMPVYQKGNAVLIRTGVEGVEFHSVGINRVFKNVTKS